MAVYILTVEHANGDRQVFTYGSLAEVHADLEEVPAAETETVTTWRVDHVGEEAERIA